MFQLKQQKTRPDPNIRAKMKIASCEIIATTSPAAFEILSDDRSHGVKMHA
jgi:hypothetical protein